MHVHKADTMSDKEDLDATLDTLKDDILVRDEEDKAGSPVMFSDNEDENGHQVNVEETPLKPTISSNHKFADPVKVLQLSQSICDTLDDDDDDMSLIPPTQEATQEIPLMVPSTPANHSDQKKHRTETSPEKKLLGSGNGEEEDDDDWNKPTQPMSSNVDRDLDSGRESDEDETFADTNYIMDVDLLNAPTQKIATDTEPRESNESDDWNLRLTATQPTQVLEQMDAGNEQKTESLGGRRQSLEAQGDGEEVMSDDESLLKDSILLPETQKIEPQPGDITKSCEEAEDSFAKALTKDDGDEEAIRHMMEDDSFQINFEEGSNDETSTKNVKNPLLNKDDIQDIISNPVSHPLHEPGSSSNRDTIVKIDSMSEANRSSASKPEVGEPKSLEKQDQAEEDLDRTLDSDEEEEIAPSQVSTRSLSMKAEMDDEENRTLVAESPPPLVPDTEILELPVHNKFDDPMDVLETQDLDIPPSPQAKMSEETKKDEQIQSKEEVETENTIEETCPETEVFQKSVTVEVPSSVDSLETNNLRVGAPSSDTSLVDESSTKMEPPMFNRRSWSPQKKILGMQRDDVSGITCFGKKALQSPLPTHQCSLGSFNSAQSLQTLLHTIGISIRPEKLTALMNASKDNQPIEIYKIVLKNNEVFKCTIFEEDAVVASLPQVEISPVSSAFSSSNSKTCSFVSTPSGEMGDISSSISSKSQSSNSSQGKPRSSLINFRSHAGPVTQTMLSQALENSVIRTSTQNSMALPFQSLTKPAIVDRIEDKLSQEDFRNPIVMLSPIKMSPIKRGIEEVKSITSSESSDAPKFIPKRVRGECSTPVAAKILPEGNKSFVKSGKRTRMQRSRSTKAEILVDSSPSDVASMIPERSTRKKRNVSVPKRYQEEPEDIDLSKTLVKVSSGTSAEESDSMPINTLPGMSVMAQWTDGSYYPGTIESQDQDERWCIRFDDGVMRTVSESFLIKIPILRVGTSVMALHIDGIYDAGTVVSHFKEDSKAGYVVELTGGTTKRFPRESVILSSDQAKLLKGDVSVTPNPGSSLDLNNIVSGRRKRKSTQSDHNDSPTKIPRGRHGRTKTDPNIATTESSMNEDIPTEKQIIKKVKRGLRGTSRKASNTKEEVELELELDQQSTASETSQKISERMRKDPKQTQVSVETLQSAEGVKPVQQSFVSEKSSDPSMGMGGRTKRGGKKRSSKRAPKQKSSSVSQVEISAVLPSPKDTKDVNATTTSRASESRNQSVQDLSHSATSVTDQQPTANEQSISSKKQGRGKKGSKKDSGTRGSEQESHFVQPFESDRQSTASEQSSVSEKDVKVRKGRGKQQTYDTPPSTSRQTRQTKQTIKTMEPPAAIDKPSTSSTRSLRQKKEVPKKDLATKNSTRKLKLFQDYAFLLTHVIRKIEPKHENQSDADSLTEGENEDFHIPFDKEELCEQILSAGGLVLETFEETQTCSRNNIILLASTYLRTIKYLQGIASNIPCIKHCWVSFCLNEKKILDLNQYRLPLGFSITSKSIVEWRPPHDNVQLLKGLKVVVTADKKSSFVEIWTPIVLASKADLVQKYEMPTFNVTGMSYSVNVIITDSTCPSNILNAARKRKIPIVSSEWLIQCIINKRQLPYLAHPKFKHDYTA